MVAIISGSMREVINWGGRSCVIQILALLHCKRYQKVFVDFLMVEVRSGHGRKLDPFHVPFFLPHSKVHPNSTWVARLLAWIDRASWSPKGEPTIVRFCGYVVRLGSEKKWRYCACLVIFGLKLILYFGQNGMVSHIGSARRIVCFLISFYAWSICVFVVCRLQKIALLQSDGKIVRWHFFAYGALSAPLAARFENLCCMISYLSERRIRRYRWATLLANFLSAYVSLVSFFF